MSNFDHVESLFLRTYLTTPVEILTGADHQQALAETQDAFEGDIRADESGIDHGIPYHALNAREAACDAFAEALNERDCTAAHVAARAYWSV